MNMKPVLTTHSLRSLEQTSERVREEKSDSFLFTLNPSEVPPANL